MRGSLTPNISVVGHITRCDSTALVQFKVDPKPDTPLSSPKKNTMMKLHEILTLLKNVTRLKKIFNVIVVLPV